MNDRIDSGDSLTVRVTSPKVRLNNGVEMPIVREPFNQEYGMREIHIGIPQTNTLQFIGQELKKN